VNETNDRYAGLTPLQRAVVALKEMRARLEQAKQLQNEPIAVIGLGCRFPGGAVDPEAYWELLETGRDAVGPVPRDRYDVERFYDPTPGTPGKTYCREGGFLERVDLFSPEFFRIAPREAEIMDPQQRLLLEVAWEALENAGQARSLGSVPTGVFIGGTTTDYGTYVARKALRDNPHYGSGNTLNSMAGRLSYVFGLHGPSLAVDTACSASLVTVHLACQNLRLRDCDLALAGGVNLLLSPEVTVNISQAGILAADGRCKAFDAAADGYGRGEGCGIVVLKRLEDAVRDRDQVLALLLGSAVNHDGASGGFTVPNGAAQQALLRRAWSAANVRASDLDYLEAHGTGTPLGDPIEIRALDAVLRDDRRLDQPLPVGSVKTNLGHLESAAGVAALIKVVLGLQNERIPAQLHLHHPSPHIRWNDVRVRIVRDPLPWPRSENRRRLAGVSSFGLSGTNAHVVVAEPPATGTRAADGEDRTDSLHALTLSAKTEAALGVSATRLAQHLEAHPEQPLADVCFTLNTGRAAFPHRLSMVASRRDEFVERLRAFAKDGATPGMGGGPSRRHAARLAFLFPGQAGQHAGIGRSLYDGEPRFREALDRCDAILRPELGRPLRELLDEPARAATDGAALGAVALESTLFAFEYALAALWTGWGVRPALVFGHGVGELVAACVAGVLGLEDALRLVVARGRAPDTVGEVAASLSYRPPAIPLISSVTGELADDDLCRLAYWAEHARRPELLEAGLRQLAARSITLFLEVGPGSSLLELGRRSLGDEHHWLPSLGLPSLAADREDRRQLLETAGALWVQGAKVDWEQVAPDPERRRVALPTYPFERRRCWVDESMAPSGLLDGETRDEPEVDRPRSSESLFELGWVELHAASELPAPARAKKWLILADRGGLAASVQELLAERGAASVCVHAGDRYQRDEQGSLTIDPREPQHFARLLDDVLEDPGPWDVLHLWSADLGDGTRNGASLDDDLGLVLASSLHMCQALLRLRGGRTDPERDAPGIWWATRGAQRIDGSAELSTPVTGSLFGFVRVLASEDPSLWRGIVDLDPEDSIVQAAEDLVHTLLEPGDEDQLAYRGGRRFVGRLVPHRKAPGEKVDLRADATYLITGGLGGLGLEVARWLVAHGARNLALLGRTGASRPVAQEALVQLRRKGVRVRVIAADAAEPADVRRALDDLETAMPPLRGIVHAAGVLHDALVGDQTWESFRRVLRPKVLGAWNLHEQTARNELDFFVLFSSAAVLGASGQSGYAAANAYLDSLAELRHQSGLPALSIQWGPWRETGMASGLDVDAHWRRQGTEPLSTEEALNALGRALSSGRAHLAVLRFHWDRLFSPELPFARWTLLRDLARPQSRVTPLSSATPQGSSSAGIRDRLERTHAAGRLALLESYVCDQIGRVIGYGDSSAMDPHAPLIDLGMDSLMAVQLRNGFRGDLGVDVTIGELLEGASIAQLSTRILDRMGHDPATLSEAPRRRREQSPR